MARRTPFQFDITAVNRTGPAWRGVENSIQRTQGAARALQRTIGLLAGAAGIGLSVRAFTQMTSRALQTAEALSDLSERAGVSVEFLQGMRLAADQNGASADQFDDSISRLNRRLGMFINTGAGPAATAFRQLGLDTRIASGELDNAEKVFNAFVIEMQKVDNVAQQAALASQLFGDRAGPQLVGMLRRGTDGLQSYQDALRETGRLMGNDVARQGAELNARLRDIRATFDDRMANVILENADAISQMAEALADVAEWGVRAASSFSTFAGAIGRDMNASPEDRRRSQMATEREAILGNIDSLTRQRARAAQIAGEFGADSGQGRLALDRIADIDRELENFAAMLERVTLRLQIFDERDAPRQAALAAARGEGRPGQRTPGVTPDGGSGSSAPARDPRALSPITDTIFVGQRTVDQFQSQIARHFGDGDLMPAIDAIGEVAEETATRVDTLRDSYDRFNLTLEDVALNGIAAVEDALVDLIMGAEGGFRDLARSVVAMLVRMAVQQTISGMLGSINLPFGGGRASGGPVRPGMGYRVGERGPEMFSPSVPGEITPMDRSGGMGGGKLHIVIEAAEGREFNARVKSIAAELAPDIIEVSVARASSEIGADLASMSDRRLRR